MRKQQNQPMERCWNCGNLTSGKFKADFPSFHCALCEVDWEYCRYFPRAHFTQATLGYIDHSKVNAYSPG